jgi:ATP-dependent helicase/DNAse subunit B
MTESPNEIWLGPLLGNNRARLIERCAELVANNQSDQFLYLAASRPLLELVTQGILDGTRNKGVWGELPVYLFRGFVRHIVSTAIDDEGYAKTPRIPIDRDELPLKRSLISQILTGLVDTKQLTAIAPLAAREGCVNTITTLIGEIQRAGKAPAEFAEIIAQRTRDLASESSSGRSQVDFDNEVGVIYASYRDLLDSNQLTEDDADQLSALAILRGEMRLPWLANINLLVLDGFFDFTPVQGDILRQLIPQIPQTLVSLNYDNRNPEIFLPFQETIGQLCAMAPFDTKQTIEHAPALGPLSRLRERLFNTQVPIPPDSATPPVELKDSTIRYFECGDRDTEIRSIAREIKQLILRDNYKLSDIALIVRQRASYAPTIARVMREESVACNLEPRVETTDVPAIRAALKLLDVLQQRSAEEDATLRIAELADLIKSEYFRLSDDDLTKLSALFDAEHLELLGDTGELLNDETAARLKSRYRIGFWDADALENAFAYVGSELPVSAWLSRARKLIKELPTAEATKQLLNIDAEAPDRDPDIADQVENAETVKLEEKGLEKKRRPSRDIHPATLAWTAMVIQRFAELITAVPQEGRPADLRVELMRLLDQLQFPAQIALPTRSNGAEEDLPQIMLNFNALESLRRAFVAAIKSIEIAKGTDTLGPHASRVHQTLATGCTRDACGPSDGPSDTGARPHLVTRLSTFIEEVTRSIASQSQVFGAADRAGLRVLEATDVRGLRFRAIFIAGLIEGGFPLRTSRDWIYPHEERERLKQYGLTLEDISPATLLKEEHYFYQAACRATERLYLTRPLMLEDDSETVASYYIEELRRALAPLKVESEIMRRDYDGKDVANASNTNELKVGLVRQQERQIHYGDRERLLPEPQINRLLTLASSDGLVSDAALRRIEIERERAGSAFGPYDGRITDPELLNLIKAKFGPDFVHSASGLSVYGNCSYRFFAQRVLKLEPRGEAALDLQAIDAGKLLHDILRRFFERYRRKPLNTLDPEELRKELADIADSVFDEHERVVPPLNRQIWKIDREIRKILLDQVLVYELHVQEEAAGKEVLPAYFEVAFGNTRSAAKDPASKPEPLEIKRGTLVEEETIKISGQIDRVDLANDDTLVAYDYKLSSGFTKDDIRSGRSLQIPIYLEALEKLLLPASRIAGGGYYIIRGSRDRRNKGLHKKSNLGYVNISHQAGALLSDEEWQQIRDEAIAKIWNFLDGMRAGRFLVNPAEGIKSCRFCDYSAVCRYERYRIERKKKSSTDYADYTVSESNK